jgi:hypothetical protein
MLFQIILVVAVLVAAFLMIVSLQPNDFRMSRSIIINANQAVIFPYINNLHKWDDWSPWAKLDPDCKNEFEGPDAGVGAVFKWEGNKKVGKGIMTIIESNQNELVQIQLEFLKPFKATNLAQFTLRPELNETHVTWSMFGKNSLIGKVISLVMNCEDMVGKQFDQGLATIKSLAEANR